jgi:predicted alpha/beta hydrolase family esterase
MYLCIVPRWSGTSKDDWYPWLERELSDHTVIDAPLSPSPDAPTIEACIASIEAAVDGLDLADTVLVGHSVGCQAQLRFLASRDPGTRVAGLVCVAGWWSVDEPWETIRPWIESPLDASAVRRVAPTIRVLLSDNDPFTSDHQASAAAWRERLGADVTIHAGAKHFNATEEPAVLEALRELLG